jgi:hypothetical protein
MSTPSLGSGVLVAVPKATTLIHGGTVFPHGPLLLSGTVTGLKENNPLTP